MVIVTSTDPVDEWRLVHDEPSAFRVWGSGTTYPLPPITLEEEATIGSAPDCWLQLHGSLSISRYHVRVFRHGNRWKLADLRSKNGISVDGARKPAILLTPGEEIGIGGIVLIVESPQLIELRELLARLIGWSDARRADVDRALRSVRLAATHRGSLLLCGPGGLVSIARLLHNFTLGERRPFVHCYPDSRRRTKPNTDEATHYTDGMVALKEAAGGTLCVWKSRLPRNFDQVVQRLKKPTTRVQLIICAHNVPDPRQPEMGSMNSIVLPPLSERTSELDRIVDAFAAAAVKALGGSLTSLSRDWVRQHESADLSRIASATRRFVAHNRAGGNVTEAARLLGVSRSSLKDWFRARPTGEEAEEEKE